MNVISLKKKTIVITGAGSGIGQETARVVSQLGAKVAMLDISEKGLFATESLLLGDGHTKYVVDLTNTDKLSSLVQKIVSDNGPIAGFVHCAGISSRKPLNVLSKDGFDKVMDINFYSFVELTRLISKKKNFTAEGGSIVVISSISSIRGYKAKTEYCVSKAAVDECVRCMAPELANRKIRVDSIMPPEVLTPLALKAHEMNDSVGAS